MDPRYSLLRASAASLKNTISDKPYEDDLRYDCQLGIFCVADGVTRSRDAERRYPCPSPAVTPAKIVTEEAIRQFQRAYIGNSWQAAMISIANGFAAANRRIAHFAATLPQPDFLSNDLPAAVATIVPGMIVLGRW